MVFNYTRPCLNGHPVPCIEAGVQALGGGSHRVSLLPEHGHGHGHGHGHKND